MRSPNGNLRGRAARTQRAEERLERFLSPTWLERENAAIDELRQYPHLVEIWDSELVPAKATHKQYALLAERLLQYKDVRPVMVRLPFDEGSENCIGTLWHEHGYG